MSLFKIGARSAGMVFAIISANAMSQALKPVKEDGSKLPAALIEKVHVAINGYSARLQEVFKDIHKNPELGFMETRTAAIIAKELEALGFSVRTGIGKTGVVGVLRNGDGPVVMYRADMDANAVEEATGLPYESKVRVLRDGTEEVPVAHLCGHNAHVTWLLGVAKAMVALKSEPVSAVLQPTGTRALGAFLSWRRHG